jgi:hypothetical protein
MRALLRGGDSSVSMSWSAVPERLCLLHMRTQLAWICFSQGAMFGFHLMMPYTSLLALIACLSLHRRDASPRTHHPQTDHKQQHAHASCLVVSRTAWQGKASRHGEKCDHAMEPSMPRGCKQACRHRSHGLAVCAGCVLFVRCINIHALLPWFFFSAIVCLCDSPSVSSLFFLSHSLNLSISLPHSLSQSLNFPSSLTLSLSEFPFLSHFLPLCKYIHFTILCLPPSPVFFFYFSRGVRGSSFPHILSMRIFFFKSVLSSLATSGFDRYIYVCWL